jgi:predicted tellurium resistance membrane protein TerC
MAFILRGLMLIGLDALIKNIGNLFTINGKIFTLKEVFLISGGIFLLFKSIKEIHHKLEEKGEEQSSITQKTFGAVMLQVFFLDSVFSMDFIITALGIAKHVWVMCTAVGISLICMYFFAVPLAKFIEKHPTSKILALSFLMLIGLTLVIEGMGIHIPKGYIYFAMFFSVIVEGLNIMLKTKQSKASVKINFPNVDDGILKSEKDVLN